VVPGSAPLSMRRARKEPGQLCSSSLGLQLFRETGALELAQDPGVCRGSWVGARVWLPHTCAGSQSDFQDAGACQLPGGVAQFTSCFCEQSPFVWLLVPRCLHSVLQAQTFCGKAWRASGGGGHGSCLWHSRISGERVIGDWGGEGTLDTARLGGWMEQ
jgi:hypothetical protein